jgi:hypothetical protein
MTAVVLWDRFEQLFIRWLGGDVVPYLLRSMLKIHVIQQWFGLSAAAMEEALWETPPFTRTGRYGTSE